MSEMLAYPWERAKPDVALAVYPYWDKVIIVLSDQRRLRLDYSYAEELDDAGPIDRMACRVSECGSVIEWPGIPLSVPVSQLVAHATECISLWGDPPTFVG